MTGRLWKSEKSVRGDWGSRLIPLEVAGCTDSSGLVMRSAKEPAVSVFSVDMLKG